MREKSEINYRKKRDLRRVLLRHCPLSLSLSLSRRNESDSRALLYGVTDTPRAFCGPLGRTLFPRERRPASGGHESAHSSSRYAARYPAGGRRPSRGRDCRPCTSPPANTPTGGFTTGGDLARARVPSSLTLFFLRICPYSLAGGELSLRVLLKRAKSVKYGCLRRRVFGLDYITVRHSPARFTRSPRAASNDQTFKLHGGELSRHSEQVLIDSEISRCNIQTFPSDRTAVHRVVQYNPVQLITS